MDRRPAQSGASPSDADSEFDSALRKIAHVSHVSVDPPMPRLGQIIGEKYRIDARLGRGGMGVVFRATHVVSHKPVALKWMLRSTRDGSAHRRLLREALAAGRIDHPNVVDVYDVGQEGVCAYLVMELLHGESLRARLDRGRLESSEAVDLLLPALRGVSAAHRAGVIHRDLKPDNIFLCTGPDGSPREPKVLDFGVSIVLAPNAVDPTLTDRAMILGTPAYMSPEQLASARDVDERTDVYAFGVMLYEALTGQLPFVADSYSGLLLAVVHDPPGAPSALCPEVPRELERVILQALAKQREERPESVDALLELLAPFGSTRRRERAPDPLPTVGAWNVPSPEAVGSQPPAPAGSGERTRRAPQQRLTSRARTRLAARQRGLAAGAAAGVLLLGAGAWLARGSGESAAGTSVTTTTTTPAAPPDLEPARTASTASPQVEAAAPPPSADPLEDWAPAEPQERAITDTKPRSEAAARRPKRKRQSEPVDAYGTR